MSNFCCPHCGAHCYDTHKGYITGCKHYPPDIVAKSEDDAKRISYLLYDLERPRKRAFELLIKGLEKARGLDT